MPRYRRDKVGHFYSNFCIINKVKTAIFGFAHFLENCRFLKAENIFSEDSSPKGFSDKLSEFSIFLGWPAILDIYSHGLLSTPQLHLRHILFWCSWRTIIGFWKFVLCFRQVNLYRSLSRVASPYTSGALPFSSRALCVSYKAHSLVSPRPSILENRHTFLSVAILDRSKSSRIKIPRCSGVLCFYRGFFYVLLILNKYVFKFP